MTYSIVIRAGMLEVICSRIFICIVQISCLAITCIGQPLLTFCRHPERSWMFALVVVALKITYTVLHLCYLG